MKVWVKGYLGLQTALGDRPFIEIGTDKVTVQDLLDRLGHRADELLDAPRTARSLIVLVNGRHTSHLPDGLDTVLVDGDQVAIFPPVAGG